MNEGAEWLSIVFAVVAGAIRASTPFLLVSLGECLTEKSGRINVGLEGTLVTGAMTGYGVSLLSGSPWLGVVAAGLAGTSLGLIHGVACGLRRVNDIAVGIALLIFGTGIGVFFGKPLIRPQAPLLPSIDLSSWTDIPQFQAALRINPLFLLGIVIALIMAWGFANTRIGLTIRTVGDSSEAAAAAGISVNRVRTLSTAAGGFIAGMGGASLSLFYPGSWHESLSAGQGILAVVLVIFARWKPVWCIFAALLFGGAGALGPSLQSIGITEGYHLFNAAPYLLTLAIMIVGCSPRRTLAGAPGELGVIK